MIYCEPDCCFGAFRDTQRYSQITVHQSRYILLYSDLFIHD